jgi:hypothetical protein
LNQPVSGEIYYEFLVVGQSVKVTAVDAATGVEAVVIGPVHASRDQLQGIARAKLLRRLSREAD